MPQNGRAVLSGFWNGFRRFAVYASARFQGDRCFRVAAALSYTSLLALVPLIAIGLAFLSAFPGFEDLRQEMQRGLLENLVPQVSGAVSEHISGFIANVGQMTAVGVVALALTAVLLLNTIEATFNLIWRVRRPRPLVPRLLVFWAIITLGPLLFGASLSVSGYVYSVASYAGVEDISRLGLNLSRIVSFLLQTAGLTLLYVIVPHRNVRWRDGMIGGVVAAFLFEALKWGFALYVSHFRGYQMIYGALSAVPLFLMWMYLCWVVVLIGAVITAALPEWRDVPYTRHSHRRQSQHGFLAGEDGGHGTAGHRRLALSLAVLDALFEAARQGDNLTAREIAREIGYGLPSVEETLDRLYLAAYVTRGEEGSWVLARDLHRVTFLDLCGDLSLDFTLGDWGTAAPKPWQIRTDEVLGRVAAAEREIMDVPLAKLFAESKSGLRRGAV